MRFAKGKQQMLKQIDQRILAYVKRDDWPVTTEMVAKELEISWNTAQLHLFKMQAEGLVKGKRVGRHNEWMIIKKKPKLR
jgi:predicted ArsR family transcriptional regulator